MVQTQGFFLAFRLSDKRLTLKLFRLIPLSWVRLEDVTYLRVSDMEEYLTSWKKGVRAEFWPAVITGYNRRMAPVYMLNVQGKHRRRKIYLRLKSGFHYRLRTTIGRTDRGERNAVNP